MAALTGARLMLQALAEEGVTACFANPGTTELDFVKALEQDESMRVVIGLQENVCTGGADGYGRMTGRAACTLLHLGPGFANGIANLHNARRAHTPIVNVIGDHASWHLAADAPLTSDIESLAKPVSGWVHRITGVDDIENATREAVRASLANGGQGATLIFPADHQAAPAPATRRSAPAAHAPALPVPVRALAQRLAQAKNAVFLLGGGDERSALGERGQRAVARILTRVQGRAFAETFPARAERGRGLPAYDRLPYFPEPARAVLDAADVVVLAGALPPVTYFGYEGHPSRLVEDARLLALGAPGDDVAATLEALADELGAAAYTPSAQTLPPIEDGPLDPQRIGAVLASLLPHDSIVSVEGGTCGYPFYAASAGAARHTALTNTGGAIGQGLPVALGAAIACPGRQTVALLSDGSTQYTVQALWTIAREDLPIVTLIAANHQYAILRNELRRGNQPLGNRAAAMTSLEHPRIDWVGLANAYGMKAERAATTAEFAAALQRAFSAHKPCLIEMAL